MEGPGWSLVPKYATGRPKVATGRLKIASGGLKIVSGWLKIDSGWLNVASVGLRWLLKEQGGLWNVQNGHQMAQYSLYWAQGDL